MYVRVVVVVLMVMVKGTNRICGDGSWLCGCLGDHCRNGIYLGGG